MNVCEARESRVSLAGAHVAKRPRRFWGDKRLIYIAVGNIFATQVFH